MARVYDRTMFHGATFKDLMELGRPLIAITATDINYGTPFVFTQETFDILCSDLTTFPLARAVAASNGFPGLFSPITITNHADACGGRKPGWLTRITEQERRDPLSRLGLQARNIERYLDPQRTRYVHLSDGGVSDNLGLRSVGGIMENIAQSPRALTAWGGGSVATDPRAQHRWTGRAGSDGGTTQGGRGDILDPGSGDGKSDRPVQLRDACHCAAATRPVRQGGPYRAMCAREDGIRGTMRRRGSRSDPSFSREHAPWPHEGEASRDSHRADDPTEGRRPAGCSGQERRRRLNLPAALPGRLPDRASGPQCHAHRVPVPTVITVSGLFDAPASRRTDTGPGHTPGRGGKAGARFRPLRPAAGSHIRGACPY